jgi:23S rRNA pseudouridine1911/1915/1917 synthase
MKEGVVEAEKRPLLQWLLARHPETPKTRAKQWIQAGRVSVAGKILRRPQEMIGDPGPALELLGRRATSLDLGAEWRIHPRVALLHLDASLAAVNKGPGLISVPSGEEELSALSIVADFLSGKLKAAARGSGGRTLPPAYRKLTPLPVHRLDQYTSGVFCLAMNPEARRILIDQLNARAMKREYVAFVEGRPGVPAGTWRHWVRLNDNETRQQIVSAPAKTGPVEKVAQEETEAITHFEVMAEFAISSGKDCVTKLRLRLETGRKHQIRAQAAHVGLPLIGDRAYNVKYNPTSRARPLIPFSRQALHAESLSLEHPLRQGERMTWRAELPDDLRALEESLRRGRF